MPKKKTNEKEKEGEEVLTPEVKPEQRPGFDPDLPLKKQREFL